MMILNISTNHYESKNCIPFIAKESITWSFEDRELMELVLSASEVTPEKIVMEKALAFIRNFPEYVEHLRGAAIIQIHKTMSPDTYLVSLGNNKRILRTDFVF